MKHLKEFVNAINSGHFVDEDSFKANIVKGIYNTYSKELKMFDVNGSMSIKNRYNGLLRLLTDIRRKFDVKFKKTVDSTPGMKVYMMTHVVFTKDDLRSSDWFTSFMMSYLFPTDKDMKDFSDLNTDMEEVLLADGVKKTIVDGFKEMGCYIPHPYDDEIILRFGLWNRDESGKIVAPIYFNDTINEPTMVARKLDVKKIIDEAGLLDLVTGEIVIASDIVE